MSNCILQGAQAAVGYGFLSGQRRRRRWQNRHGVKEEHSRHGWTLMRHTLLPSPCRVKQHICFSSTTNNSAKKQKYLISTASTWPRVKYPCNKCYMLNIEWLLKEGVGWRRLVLTQTALWSELLYSGCLIVSFVHSLCCLLMRAFFFTSSVSCNFAVGLSQHAVCRARRNSVEHEERPTRRRRPVDHLWSHWERRARYSGFSG